jgi:undecaprenyl-diphosphatase UppP
VVLPLWQACLLGAVQGLTEFLPVSSTGHLAIGQHFLSDMPEAEKVAIDVALHIGTLVAVVGYFRREIFEMAGALVGRRGAAYARTWIVLLFLGTLPAAVIGLALKDRIEAAFDSLPLIGGCFLVTGVLLFLASAVRGAHRTEEDLRPRDALVVGCFQAFALLPGVSRSGSTIAGALFLRARGDVAPSSPSCSRSRPSRVRSRSRAHACDDRPAVGRRCSWASACPRRRACWRSRSCSARCARGSSGISPTTAGASGSCCWWARRSSG